MNSCFQPVTNPTVVPWGTRALSTVSAGARDRLAQVVAAIATHFLPGCPYHRNEGSITFQSPTNNHEVVCVFVDDGNRLAKHEGLTQLAPEPIVAAIEVDSQPLFMRRTIRDWLLLHFPLHLDPTRPPYHQYWILPNRDHRFDVLFLPPGRCPWDVDDDVLQAARAVVEQPPTSTGKIMKARRRPDV